MITLKTTKHTKTYDQLNTLSLKLANQLIRSLELQAGIGLCYLLGMTNTLDNHQAVRIWVKDYIHKRYKSGLDNDNTPNEEMLYHDIKQAFVSLLPNYMQAELFEFFE